RRFEIPGVLTHDTAIHPSACGGPLFDRDGVLVGINIARALRVATYALPLNTVNDVVVKALAKPDA
ncbi:MAG: S1C family serine protease, partial [Planctomycetota bacterium]